MAGAAGRRAAIVLDWPYCVTVGVFISVLGDDIPITIHVACSPSLTSSNPYQEQNVCVLY